MFYNLIDYKKWLHQTLTIPENDYSSRLLEVINLFGQKQYICTLLQLIIKDPETLHKTSLQSYTHTNGFDKIVLFSSSCPQYKLRLHIWWPHLRKMFAEDIHNHRWDFSSVVLTGSYTSQEFDLNANGIEMYRYRYFPPGEQKHFTMDFIGTEKLKCVSENVLIAGSHYTQSYPVLHRIVNDEQKLTATLMLQGPVKSPVCDVFTDQKIQNPEKVVLSPLSVPVLSEKIASLLAALECL